LILDALPKGSKYNQDYSLDNLLPALNQVRARNGRLKVALTLMMHMDNSMCHTGTKTAENMSSKGLRQASNSGYSPDISPSDFWAFETMKKIIKDQHMQDPEVILRRIQEACNHFIFEDFQNVFKSSIERLTCVIAYNGKYCH
jgi:hypothetical protein